MRAERLLSKWAVEERTSLDITTIYRKMKAGTFPQPVRVGRRRVAWRESDIAAWQQALAVGVAAPRAIRVRRRLQMAHSRTLLDVSHRTER
jgi:prophage regulatory protein